MGPVTKNYEDDGVVRLSVDSGGMTFRVTAERARAGLLAREPTVRYSAPAPVSPRQADDFAALLQMAAAEART